MKYANLSVKYPEELDRELEETGVYTNKSAFIKESIRRHLIKLNNEPAIAALRIEQLLARAEQEPASDDELHARLDDFRQVLTDRGSKTRSKPLARKQPTSTPITREDPRYEPLIFGTLGRTIERNGFSTTSNGSIRRRRSTPTWCRRRSTRAA